MIYNSLDFSSDGFTKVLTVFRVHSYLGVKGVGVTLGFLGLVDLRRREEQELSINVIIERIGVQGGPPVVVLISVHHNI